MPRLLLICVLLISCLAATDAQCLRPELAMINSCIEHPNPDPTFPNRVEGELIIARSSLLPITVADILIDIPANGFGPDNNDINVDFDDDPIVCGWAEPNVDLLPGCPNVVALGPDDVLPANSRVVIFTTFTTANADVLDTDFSNLCDDGETVYVLQNSCERTISAFSQTPGGNSLRTIGVFSPCGSTSFTYNINDLDPDDGTFFLVSSASTGNLDCDFPVLPEFCQPIDLEFTICGAGDTVDPPYDLQAIRDLYPETVFSVEFFTTLAGADGNGEDIEEYTGPTAAPDTLYSRILYEADFCVAIGTVVVRFSDDPLTATTPVDSLNGCALGQGGLVRYDFTELSALVGSGEPVEYSITETPFRPLAEPDEVFLAVNNTEAFARIGLGECRSTPVRISLRPGLPLVVNAVVENASCGTVDDGSIELTVAGDGPFTYVWNDPRIAGPGGDGLAAGEYRVTVTDDFGCARTQVQNVLEGIGPGIDCSVVRQPFPDSTNGVIRVVSTTVQPLYEYVFLLSYNSFGLIVSTTDQDYILDEIGPGIHTVFLRDPETGCESAPCTLELVETEPLSLDCAAVNNTNGSDIRGRLGFTVAGGSEPYTVRVTGPGGLNAPVPAATTAGYYERELNSRDGTFTVTVTDADGNSIDCEVDIEEEACPLEVDFDLLVADCSGENNTIIRLDINGSSGMISTVWAGPDMIENDNGQQESHPLPAGNYFVTVTDQNPNCAPVELGPIVVEDFGIALFTAAVTGVSAPCATDGRVSGSVISGGIPPFTVELRRVGDGAVLGTVTDLEFGEPYLFTGLSPTADGVVYEIVVFDSFGCPGAPETIFSVPGPASAQLTLDPSATVVTDVACASGTSGSIVLAAEGGQLPYVYRWIDYPGLGTVSPFPDENEIDSLVAGDYEVEVTDDNGCRDTFLFTIADGGVATIQCSNPVDAVGSTGGTIDLLFGGIADFTARIFTTTDTFTRVYTAEGPFTFTDLPRGDYEAVVVDANGCISDTCTFTIDGVGCQLSASANRRDGNCEIPARIAITGTGGTEPYSYQWSDPSFGNASEVFPDTAGFYRVTVTDANNCERTVGIPVTYAADGPRPVFEADSYVLCPGDDLVIPITVDNDSSSFNVTYFIRDDQGVSGDTFRVFGLTGTDTLRIPASQLSAPGGEFILGSLSDGRCVFERDTTLDFTFGSPDTLAIRDTFCPGEMPVFGGRTFSEASPSDTFPDPDVTTGCGRVLAVDLTFQGPGIIPDTLEPVICARDTFELNGEFFTANRREGLVTFSRPAGCDSLVYVRLSLINPGFGPLQNIRGCPGDVLVFADTTFTEDFNGIYEIEGGSANGCDSIVPLSVTFVRPGEVVLLGDQQVCSGEEAEFRFRYNETGSVNLVLQGSNGERVELNGVGNNTRRRLAATRDVVYTILSAEKEGCPVATDGNAILEVTNLTVSIDAGAAGDCGEVPDRLTAIPLGGTGEIRYEWSTTETLFTIPIDSAGSYTVEVTDSNNCVATATVNLVDGDPPRFFPRVIPPDCDGDIGTLVIDSLGGGVPDYELAIGLESPEPVAIGDRFLLEPGRYDLRFTDANGCVRDSTIDVPFAPEILLSGFGDENIILGDSVIFNLFSSVEPDTVIWSPAAFVSLADQLNTVARPLENTTYTVTVQDENGCTTSASIRVEVDLRVPVFAPTAFSPNGDGINDTYELGLGDRGIVVLSFQIFSRWGDLVFSDPNMGWDGLFLGKPAPLDVYVLAAEIRLADGTVELVRGDITLVR